MSISRLFTQLPRMILEECFKLSPKLENKTGEIKYKTFLAKRCLNQNDTGKTWRAPCPHLRLRVKIKMILGRSVSILCLVLDRILEIYVENGKDPPRTGKEPGTQTLPSKRKHRICISHNTVNLKQTQSSKRHLHKNRGRRCHAAWRLQ